MTEQKQEPAGNIEIPKIETPKKERKGKGMEQLFVTLLVLTVGLLSIVFVGDWLLSTMPSVTGIAELQEMLRSTGMMIVYTLGGLTALVFVGWLIARRAK